MFQSTDGASFAQMMPTSAFVRVAVAVSAYLFLYSIFSRRSLRHIPTVGGPSWPLLSYIGAFRFYRHAKAILQEGYDKYKGSVFKVAMYDQWLVIVTGTRLVHEIQTLSDDKISFIEGVGELIGARYIIGAEFHEDPYHVAVVRSQLTRSISSLYSDIYDEIDQSFKALVPATEKEWRSMETFMLCRVAVARVTSRVFVGQPICYLPQYLTWATNFTIEFMKARAIINRFPISLKQLVADYAINMDALVAEGLEILGPTIEERMELGAKCGENWDKPVDFLQWIIDEVTARGLGPKDAVRRLLAINFAAIFTTSNSLAHALHHLAASPEFAEPLREEIESVVAREGWTKASLGQMRKLDSFMRESQRCNGINITSVTRMAMQDITLSDGTYLPKRTVLVAPSLAMHTDSTLYTDPDVFNPWRFVDMRDDDDEAKLKHQFATTSVDFIAFGHGKHACPGRFFAVAELKTLMAYIVVNYDLKLPREGHFPKPLIAFMSVIPDPTAQVLFRKRIPV